jgi:hypothetical protein
VHEQGWYRDPYGIHSDRWFSDGRPTRLVRDQDVESYDVPPPRDPPLPLVPVPEDESSDGEDLLRADVPKREWANPADGSGGMGIGFA